jgi:hypothetical protein
VDTIFRNETRLGRSDIRDLQDAHNVNLCDGNDETWFDGDTGACDHITVIDSFEFFERYVD